MLNSVICKRLSIILHNSKSLKRQGKIINERMDSEYRNDIDMQYKVYNKYSNDEKYVMCAKTKHENILDVLLCNRIQVVIECFLLKVQVSDIILF